jgi:hypothetical protein
MSLSKEWFQEHLTPNGWVSGSYRYDSAKEVKKDAPDDRVLTLCFFEEQTSFFSKMHLTYEEEWRSDTEEQVKSLIKEYGEIPESYQCRGYLKV